MSVLLTGGLGYIGSHTAIALAQHGFSVALLDNLINSQPDVLERIEKITGSHIPFIKGNVCDTDLLRQIFRDYSIDAVIHFAGSKSVDESVRNPIDYYANNVVGAISLVSAMKSENIKTLVFSSSATVYGEPQYLPLDENHPTSATNPYGRNKLHIEEMFSDIARSDPAWSVVCLRYFNPVGAHESGLIGESPIGIPNNLMPYIAQVAAGKRPALTIFGNDYPTPDGTGVRDYIHIMDLAEGHIAALHYSASNPGWNAFNLGTGKGYSVLEMVKSFETASQRVIPYQITSRRPGDVAKCYASPTKAGLVLGWSTRRTLDDMCSSAWKFQQHVN